ncbi:hypothetical protein B5807_11632 [Epicoccum nigrum]|jgi:hypothetical protein|uniref:Uncharacterized protein n=1 Tax=Epicoccum nigrum TaxID=105696 RepID=A0A1Y2LJC6_EPING|nr:hypothetical protein B5807_11632 [Epicoccum nigrum]
MTTDPELRPLGTNCPNCPTPHVHDKVTTLEISTSAIFDFNEVLFNKMSERHVPAHRFRELAHMFPNLDYFIVVDDCKPIDKDGMSAWIWVDIRMALSKWDVFSPSVRIRLEHRPRTDGVGAFVMRAGPPWSCLPIPLDGYWEAQDIGLSSSEEEGGG